MANCGPRADSLGRAARQYRIMTTLRSMPHTSLPHRLSSNLAAITVSALCLVGLCAGFAALAAVAFDGMVDFFLPG